jgi:hypothetical protein
VSEPLSPRARCYHAIRHAFSAAIAGFVAQHPELLNDMPRLESATYAMLKLMEEVLAKLDTFDVSDKGQT